MLVGEVSLTSECGSIGYTEHVHGGQHSFYCPFPYWIGQKSCDFWFITTLCHTKERERNRS